MFKYFKRDLNPTKTEVKVHVQRQKHLNDNLHGRDAESLEHGTDAESLEHDVRHALAARLQDHQRQVQTAETSKLAPAGKP